MQDLCRVRKVLGCCSSRNGSRLLKDKKSCRMIRDVRWVRIVQGISGY